MAKLKEGKISKRLSFRLLDSRVGRDSLPRYRRVGVKTYERGASRATVYAFHMKRAPHWVIIGKGWVSNMSDVDFVGYYEPSNAEARGMMDRALDSFGPDALEAYFVKTGRRHKAELGKRLKPSDGKKGRRLLSRRGKD
jgi:hypothetical protein